MNVRVVEVGPRDGLQNEPAPIPAAVRRRPSIRTSGRYSFMLERIVPAPSTHT